MLTLKYKGVPIPVFTVAPNWGAAVKLRMMDRIQCFEALDTSEERLRARPRPLLGVRYTTLTLSARETGYIRRVLELPDALPFAMPLWMDGLRLTATGNAGETALEVESTADTLWVLPGRPVERALVWTAFDTWEVVSVPEVGANELTLETGLTGTWTEEGAFVFPLAVGWLSRADKRNISADHATFNADFEERFISVSAVVTDEETGEEIFGRITFEGDPRYSREGDHRIYR